MNLKVWKSAIPMISVVIMLIWGFVGNGWSYSWLAVVCGGVVAGILHMVDKNRQDNEKNQH